MEGLVAVVVVMVAALPYQLFVDPPIPGVEAVYIVVWPDAAFLRFLQLQGQQVLHAELAEDWQRLKRWRGGEGWRGRGGRGSWHQ